MAKRNLGIVSKMISDMPATTPEEPKSEEVVKKDTSEEKKKATKGKKTKGCLSNHGKRIETQRTPNEVFKERYSDKRL